ncbi:hypothetical protein ACS0TY_011886 [Phlomoides rotata]
MGSMKMEIKKFTEKNDYSLWKIKVRALLTHHGLIDALKPPTEGESSSSKEKGRVSRKSSLHVNSLFGR